MNKQHTSEDAIFELETTNSIEILNDEETKEYEEALKTSKYKKDTLIKELQNKGFSEFIIGVAIGMLLISEDKIRPKENKKNIIQKLKEKWT